MTKLQKTRYAGVYWRTSPDPATGKPEKVFYIRYRTKKAEGGWTQRTETAGRQNRDDTTLAKASHIRAKRMHGDQLPNRERRSQAARKKKAWTISALWEEYRRARPDLKDNGSMTGNYNKYIGPHFGNKEPKDILALDIDRLKRRELKDKSPATVVKVLELLRRLCNFGLKRGLCLGLSFIIEMPRVDNVRTEDLTPGQLKRLLEVIHHHTSEETPSQMAAYAMHLVLLTGVRRGELFKLKWADLNFHRRNITLQKPKGGRTQTIPMSTYAERLFQEIREVGDKSEFVFPGLAGGQRKNMLSANTVKAEAGLPEDFRPLHGLRHLFGTNLGNAGVDRDIIARLMTHARDRSVTSRYVHYREETLREAAELAGRLVEEAAASKIVNLQKGQT